MKYNPYIKVAGAMVAIAGLALALPAFAQMPNVGGQQEGGEGRGGQNGRMMGWQRNGTSTPRMMGGQGRGGFGIFGTVLSVSGSTITVSGRQGFASTSATVSYTVDASSAKVMKAGAASSVSAIAVGDTVSVQGAVTGTNIVAKAIRDGVQTPMMGGRKPGTENGNNGQGQNGGMPAITGNGQPIVAGNVTSVSGNTVIISNSSNVQYTIDATSAKITKPGVASSTIANVSVGDSVVVQGLVNGNSVTASNILDGGTKAPQGTNPAPENRGFFGGIRSFFGKMFGF